VFRPERWFERDQAAMQKTFNPFSYGPRLVFLFSLLFGFAHGFTWNRACVGRNFGFYGVVDHRLVHLAPI